ncbi:unnamed protein product [Heterobilharzia americana]|nr:unnamed protein product [Heterobilharzia americana]
MSIVSRLPGGGLGQSDKQNSSYTTLLDCILYYPPVENTDVNSCQLDCETNQILYNFYVIDIIFMRCTTYASLRFYERYQWMEEYLKQQIEEYDQSDSVRFHVIPSYKCNTESMQNAVSSMPSYQIDGVLFYHEDVNYEPGATPLVSWLKPYMLPEWFPSIKFHPDFLKDIPSNYTDYLNEIQQYEAKIKPPKDLSTVTEATTE